MKRLILILAIALCSLTTLAQTQTKKWNSIMKRYEYYQGYTMVGVEVYNSILDQWEYTATNQPAVGTKQVTPYIQPYDLDLIERAARYSQERLDAQRSRNQQIYDYNLSFVNKSVANFNNAVSQLPESIANSYNSRIQAMITELNTLMDKTNILDGNSVTYLINRVTSYITTMNSWDAPTSVGTTTPPAQTYSNRQQSTTVNPDVYVGKYIALYSGAPLYHTPAESDKADKYTGGSALVIEKISNTVFYKVLYNNKYYYVRSVYLKLPD